MADKYKYAVGYTNAVLMGIKTYIQVLPPEEQAKYMVKLTENAGLARTALGQDLGQDAVEGFDTAFEALLRLEL